MAQYQTKQSYFAFGPRQTNYQTLAADTSSPPNWRWITKDGYDKPTFESPNLDNSGESTGSALPNKTYKGEDKTSFSAQEQLTFQLLGIRANDAFGVAATPVTVATGVYEHNFSLLDPFVSAVLPSRPLAVKINEPAVSGNKIYDAKFASMTYNTFAITDSSDKPNLLLNSEWLGSGQVTEPSGIQFYGTGRHVLGSTSSEITETPINRRAGVTTIYPNASYGGTAITTNCLVRAISISINENLNPNYSGCGLFQDGDQSKGAIAGSANSTGQTVGYEFTLIADSTVLQSFAVHPRLKAGTEFSLKTVFTGPIIATTYNHMATFGLSRAVIQSVEWVDVDGGGQGIRIVAQPLASGNLLPLTLKLQTNVADFQTYVGA